MEPIEIPAITVDITPYSFHRWAGHYFAAAKAVPVEEKFSPVPHFLRGRALELVLKAYVATTDYPRWRLKRRIGHNLERALGVAEERGLAAHVVVSESERALVRKLSAVYRRKGLEYMSPGDAGTAFKAVPDTRELDPLIERLLTGLAEVCR